MNTGILILAAGKGTRMYSDTPKVLLPLLHEPMLRYVLDAVMPLAPGKVWTVIGHKADMIASVFNDGATVFIEQKAQLGTGHALQTAWPVLRAAGLSHVLVVSGDIPLISESALRHFVAAAVADNADVAFITLTPADTASFGRVLRKDGEVVAIIEATDYDIRRFGPCPKEINAGIYCLRMDSVAHLVPRLSNANKSGEVYITDVVELAVAEKLRVFGFAAGDDMNLLGVNSPAELVACEEMLRHRIVRHWLDAGVHIHAPHMARIGPKVVLEPGAELSGPCELYGDSAVRRGAAVSSHVYMLDSVIACKARVHSFSHLVGARVGESCIVGPFARMRPGAVMEEGAHLGNFVEVKQARLGKGAKANHLAYVGDADVGENVNIGAGAITCNYDGKKKHRTTIAGGAFIGSNCSLVAPVSIGEGALIGAGSVITKDVPENTLALARARQALLPRKLQ